MLTILLSVASVLLLLLIVGLLLPKEREFVKTANLKSPPERVFKIVTDVENQTSWRNDIQEIKVIDQYTWTETPKKGTPITFKTKQKVENQIFEIEIIEPKSFNGYWVGTFEQIPTGTKVHFKEVVVIKNPFFRVLSAVFVDLDQTMEDYMTNLKTHLGN